VPRLTFFAALGAVIARGGDHREVFDQFRPGIDLRAEAERLGVAGRSDLVPSTISIRTPCQPFKR
jgi:hypothetical protein